MRKRNLALIVSGGLVAALALAPSACSLEAEAMGPGVRERALAAGLPGAFVTLPEGVVHYELGGPEGGPVAVLIHGASGPMAVWDKTAGALRAEGLRVLRYDLFGRGHSDRPDAAYDEPFYHAQLGHLLDALDLRGPVALVGSSMGGVVAAGYANAHPERVSRVALIGPAGFPLEATPAARLLHVPLVGEYVMRTLGGRQLLAHNRKYLYRPDAAPELHAIVREQASYDGLGRAILATIRHFPLEDMGAGYSALGRSGKPVLLVWGRHDQTFPFSHSDRARELMPGAAFVPVDEAAHLPQYERPDVVNPALARFLKGGLAAVGLLRQRPARCRRHPARGSAPYEATPANIAKGRVSFNALQHGRAGRATRPPANAAFASRHCVAPRARRRASPQRGCGVTP